MQRRIQQTDRDRQPRHRFQDADEILALHRQDLCQARARAARAFSAMIISRTAEIRSGSKNMCSVRHSPIPSAPNSRATLASLRSVGVGAHA